MRNLLHDQNINIIKLYLERNVHVYRDPQGHTWQHLVRLKRPVGKDVYDCRITGTIMARQTENEGRGQGSQ